MVKISQQDFNREMDKYINNRLLPDETKIAKAQLIHENETREFEAEESQFYGERQRSLVQKLSDFLLGEETRITERPEHIAESDKGFLARFTGWLSPSEEYEDEFGEAQAEELENKDELDEDIKKVLKIQNKWLKELPPDKIQAFKDSDDYALYKEILSKYHLIKES